MARASSSSTSSQEQNCLTLQTLRHNLTSGTLRTGRVLARAMHAQHGAGFTTSVTTRASMALMTHSNESGSIICSAALPPLRSAGQSCGSWSSPRLQLPGLMTRTTSGPSRLSQCQQVFLCVNARIVVFVCILVCDCVYRVLLLLFPSVVALHHKQ